MGCAQLFSASFQKAHRTESGCEKRTSSDQTEFLVPPPHFPFPAPPPDCVCRACGLRRRDPHTGPALWLGAGVVQRERSSAHGTHSVEDGVVLRFTVSQAELPSDFPSLPGPFHRVESSSPPGW